MPLITLPVMHRGQARVLKNLRRFNLCRMGRRWGKTVFGLDYLLDDWGDQPGALRGLPVAWYAPAYKYLIEPWEDAKRQLKPLTIHKDETFKTLRLSTGGSITFWTLDVDDPSRGRKFSKVFLDEAAMVRNLLRKWQEAIRPTLTDYQGHAMFGSTPKGRNDFWRLHEQHRDDPAWALHHAPTRENPYIPPSEIDRAKETLPERVYLQEYEAEFMDTGGGVFRRVLEAVDHTLDPECRDGEFLPAHSYVIAIDWGRNNDFTVIIVIDATTRTVCGFDRFNKISYAIQLARVKAMAARFPKAPILAETNAMGGPLVEELQQREGLPVRGFTTTAASKAMIIEQLAIAFEKDMIRMPMIPPLISECLAFDQERLPGGAMRYGAPDGEHDDCVMALAICWHGVTLGVSQQSVASAGKRMF